MFALQNEQLQTIRKIFAFSLSEKIKVIDLTPQAVGKDSGVQLSLSNFLEDILQPIKFQNVTNVKFRSLALIFNSKFGHKLYSSVKIT